MVEVQMNRAFHRLIRGAVAAAFFVILPTISFAQERATFLMRSGERISGQLIDMGGIGFTVTIAGEERQLAEQDVAEIELGDPDRPVGESAYQGARDKPAVWLRSGDVVEGELYDIDGTRPLRITLRTKSGKSQFSSTEIRKIVLSASASTIGTTGTVASPQSPAGIDVPATAWIPTGIVVRPGEVLTFSTTGQIQLSGEAEDIAGPAGARSQRTGTDSPLPNVPEGALIGRIGDGPPFPIADATSATMPAAGQLFLGVNDSKPADNTGTFRVSIQRPPIR
jgi:hypothetical protein